MQPDRKMLGARVLVEGEIVNVGHAAYGVIFPGQSTHCPIYPNELRAIPTPSQQLRDAAEVLVGMPDTMHVVEVDGGYSVFVNTMRSGLLAIATRLEASSTPKPPTLREAVKKYRALQEHQAAAHLIKQARDEMDAALAREEGTTDA